MVPISTPATIGFARTMGEIKEIALEQGWQSVQHSCGPQLK